MTLSQLIVYISLHFSDTLNQDPRFSESEFQAFLKSESGKAEEWAQDFESLQGRPFILCECCHQTSQHCQHVGTASGTQKLAGQDQWVEEFVDMTDQDVEAAYKSDFWSNLEDQWKSMDKEEHPWLDDFEQVCDFKQIQLFVYKIQLFVYHIQLFTYTVQLIVYIFYVVFFSV